MKGLVTKMVVQLGPERKRYTPREGDRKTVKGVEYVRRQAREKRTGACYVQNGRPVWEWVRA